jgi:glucose/arabinose dehydrogenase
VRVAPDGLLFVAIGSQTSEASAPALASPAGKILRIRADGTTPDDNPWRSPVFSLGHRDPRGLAWSADGAALWEVESDGTSSEVNVIRRGANYGFPTARTQGALASTPPSAVLANVAEPSGSAIVTSITSPLFGDLLVSTLAGRDIHRLRIATPEQGRTDALLQGRYGRIAQLSAGQDGALFFITANADTWGAGRDVVVRVEVIR